MQHTSQHISSQNQYSKLMEQNYDDFHLIADEIKISKHYQAENGENGGYGDSLPNSASPTNEAGSNIATSPVDTKPVLPIC